MTQLAKGPNGRPMIALTKDEKAAGEQQAAVFLNGQHDEADRDPETRDKIEKDEMLVTAVKRDAKDITKRWDIPREVPLGPHAGKWAIYVPADERRMNERDPKTGEEKDKDHPAWKSPEIVEDDPSWWPVDDDV